MTLPSFDLPSAKNMTIETAVSTFVPTPLYWTALHSNTHDVIFGTRGSGKTMLLRMMSLRHLTEFAKREKMARDSLYIQKRFGIFVPLGIDWCAAYRDDGESTLPLFVDGANLVASDCLVDAIEHLLTTDILVVSNRIKVETALAEELSRHWFREECPPVFSFTALRNLLLRQQAILRDVWRDRSSPPSEAEFTARHFAFRSSTLLRPIADAVSIANRALGLPHEHRWAVCLDELEDLKPRQTQALMTLIRGLAAPLTLKITTQPYTLDSSQTAFSSNATAVDFRDFEIRRLQHDPADKEYRTLVSQILRKRVTAFPQVPADKLGEKLFGDQTLTDRAETAVADFKEARAVLTKSADNPDSARKRIPILAIRALKRSAEGHAHSIAYAGWDTIVRASDGNPGMFVRILNALELQPETESQVPLVRQHEVLTKLASNWHEWSTALYGNGATLHRLIESLGKALSHQLHDRRQDVLQSQEINRFFFDLGELDAETAMAFKVGARHSLFVAETMGGSVRYPSGRGVWRLSYALAPKYWLLLRRGRIGNLGLRQLAFGFDSRGSSDGLRILDEAALPEIESALIAEEQEV